MKVAIFGATGGVGRNLLEQALAAGHDVTALARDPQKLHRADQSLTVVEGDVRDADAVRGVVDGQDAVLIALGAPLLDNSGIRAEGTRVIVDAMQKSGVRRLVCLSVFGAGDSWALLPRFYRWFVMPVILRRVLKDHVAQEAVVASSVLEWSLVRPANFTDGDLTGTYWHGQHPPMHQLSMKISRADVADFMLKGLGDRAGIGQAECVSA
jgi:uncharacterized protein YbjT (DUF2867 family)